MLYCNSFCSYHWGNTPASHVLAWPTVQDAATYLIAAWCAMQLPVALGAPDAMAAQLKKSSSMREVELVVEAGGAGAGAGGEAWELEAGGGDKGRLLGDSTGYGLDAAAVTHAERRQHHHPQKQGLLQPLGREPAGAGLAEVPVLHEHDRPGTAAPAAAAAAAAGAAQRGVHASSLNGGPMPSAAGASGTGSSSFGARSVLAAAAAAIAEGLSAMRQGWDYAHQRTETWRRW